MCVPWSRWQPFFKMADQSIDFNVSACCKFRMIEFLVSIHACVWPRNANEIVATTYPHEMCKNDAHKGGGLHIYKNIF